MNATSGSSELLTLEIRYGWLAGVVLALSTTFRGCRAPASLITILDYLAGQKILQLILDIHGASSKPLATYAHGRTMLDVA